MTTLGRLGMFLYWLFCCLSAAMIALTGLMMTTADERGESMLGVAVMGAGAALLIYLIGRGIRYAFAGR